MARHLPVHDLVMRRAVVLVLFALSEPRDVYITPTFAPSQGTAGLSLGGTF